MSLLEAARAYCRRGWSVIPIPLGSKNPGYKGWQQMRLKESDLGCFNAAPRNIGVLLGEPSGWLIDIDLDHSRCVALADDHLPATPAVFGRAGKPRSHRIYRVTGPVGTMQYKSKSAGTLVELRATGLQTVFPPSTHQSGEPITWETEGAEPALVDPQTLQAAVQRLADAVRVELGEPTRLQRPSRKPPGPPRSALPRNAEHINTCVAAMLRMRMTDSHDGSGRLFAAACRVVEHDLNDTEGIAAIRTYAQQQPFPRCWSDDQILTRIRDAERRTDRGRAHNPDEEERVALGMHDPATGRIVLSPKKTLPTAEAFVREFHERADGRTLHSYAGALWAWRSNRFVEIEEEALRHTLQPWLHDALRYGYDPSAGEMVLTGFDSNPGTIKAAVDSVRAYTHLPVSITPPAWLSEAEQRPDPRELLPCLSGNLHIPTGQVLPATPSLFNTNALEFDYDPHAAEPTHWLSFLGQLFEDDLQAWDLLQEWFGYCLTGDTSQQKMLLLIGPKRSGKGTIARVLTRLVGAGNVCGPTTSSLAGTFGLQPLLGKSLALVSDARFSGENIPTVVERLLCISGEDTLTVDRKFMTSVTMKLPTRFMFLTNEIPRLSDASGALAGRFLLLRLTESFYGREDINLTNKLLAELPGILNWAIEGWCRLHQRSHFVQPKSAVEAVRELEDLSSPVNAFVRECCDVGPGLRIWLNDLYAAWKAWCEQEGRTIVPHRHTFGRDLAAAVPGVLRRRGMNDVPFYEGIELKPAMRAGAP